MKLTNANVLVTGGTGFVGSHLVEELIIRHARVVTTFQAHHLDSYFSTQNLSTKVTLIQADVEDYAKVLDIITRYEISYIFHLAAQPIVETAYHNPKRTLTTNIVGTINILEAARNYPKTKAVIIASSDKAYGKLKKGQYKETDALKGDHPYEVSKSAADLISYSYFRTYGLPVAITRFGNIYGEGDLNFSRLIPGAMRALATNKTLELRSDGTHVRDFLYVKDVVNGYLALAENIKKAKGEAFNFGSQDTMSVLELIETINNTLNQKLKYQITNTAKNEIPYQTLNDNKIKKTIGWKQQYRMVTVLPQIYQWYSSIIN